MQIINTYISFFSFLLSINKKVPCVPVLHTAFPLTITHTPYHNIHRRFGKIRINKNVLKNMASIMKIMKHDVKELLQLRFSCSSVFFSSTCRPSRFRCAASSVLSSTFGFWERE